MSVAPEFFALSQAGTRDIAVWKDPKGRLSARHRQDWTGLSDREYLKLIWRMAKDGYLKKQRALGGTNWHHRSYTSYTLTPKGQELLTSFLRSRRLEP